MNAVFVTDTWCGLNVWVYPEFISLNPHLQSGVFGNRLSHETEALMNGLGVFILDAWEI